MSPSDADHWQKADPAADDPAGVLLGGPKLDDDTADVFAKIEAERKVNFGRAVDDQLPD